MSDKPPVEKTPDSSQTPQPATGQPTPKQTDEKAAVTADSTVMHVTNDKPITDKLADIFKGDKPATPVAPAEPPRPSTPKSDTLPRKPAPLAEPTAAPKTDPIEVEAAKVQAMPAKSANPPTPAPAAPAVPASSSPQPEPLAVPPLASPLPDIENPYILSGDVDRARLVAQTRFFKNYVEKNARQFLGDNVRSLLDIGCGEGQLTQVFARLYPDARIIGVDKDEKAIEAAQRSATGIRNIEFVVGDILEGLPVGPFDAIYESMVLMHVPETAKVIHFVYNTLKPGGRFWTKDLDPSVETVIDHPAYTRLGNWFGDTLARVGARWKIGGELPPILTSAGFNLLIEDKEIYTLGTRTTEERIAMSINLGALYNARKLVNRVLQIPESEVEQAYKELIGAMMSPGGPRGNYTFMNRISQRPAVEAKPAGQAAPAGISAETTALPDIDNPYILSGDVDRARLVAQARMFRTFIEKNARRIAGDNVKRILDIGCGEGQLTQVFARLYPDAHVIGFDKDEKAIETAQRSSYAIKNLEFVVGDGTESLPPGPFDLIYESLCFVHIPPYPKIIENAYKALAPGGLLWSKEMDEKVGTAVDLPGYTEIWKTLQSAMAKIGNDIFMRALPDVLRNAGFADLHVEEELLPMGNTGIDGRIMMAIGLGVMYNGRKMISKVTQVPESTLENLYKDTVQAMMAPDAPTGHVPFKNTIVRRPEADVKPAGQAAS